MARVFPSDQCTNTPLVEIEQLIKPQTKQFPIRTISKFNPNDDYYLLDESSKIVYTLRQFGDKILKINLKFSYDSVDDVTDKFEILPDYYTVLHIANKTVTDSEKEFEQCKQRRNELLQYLISEGYLVW